MTSPEGYNVTLESFDITSEDFDASEGYIV